MKVLSILQPWASLVAMGYKRIETRSWNTKYRGELLIHASMGKQYKKIHESDQLYNYYFQLLRHGMPPMDHLPFGAIIGKVNLEAVIPCENIDASGDPFQQSMLINSDRTKFASNGATISLQEYAFGNYENLRFGWLLSNPILFKEPILCKGQLGIWNFDTKGLLNKGISHVQFTHDYEPSYDEVMAINEMYEKAKNLKVPKKPCCNRCNGSGLSPDGKGFSDTPYVCPTCNGSGR